MNSSLPESSTRMPQGDGLLSSEAREIDPVLDLHSLRRRCLGNEELVGQILDKLRAAVTGERDRLREACDQHNFAAAATIAHRLKGTAANVEAGALRQAAERIETAARSQDLEALARAVPHLEDECRRLGESVAQYHEA